MKNAKNIRQRRGNTDLKKKREKKRQAEARENCENRVRVGKAFGRLGGHEFLQLIGNSRICRVKYLLNSWRRNWTWNRIRNFNSNFQTTRSRSLSLCKIETREVLFFLFFSFFVDLKREHISLGFATQLILNGIKITRFPPVVVILRLRTDTCSAESSDGGGIRKREEGGGLRF